MSRSLVTLVLENQLQECSALWNDEGSHLVNDPLIEGKVGVLGFLSIEQPLRFLGINVCPAANNVPNLLLTDLNSLQSLG